MVITVSDSAGIRCQAGEFSLLVDSPPKRKGNLILKTRSELPIDSFISDGTIFGPGEYEISGVFINLYSKKYLIVKYSNVFILLNPFPKNG